VNSFIKWLQTEGKVFSMAGKFLEKTKAKDVICITNDKYSVAEMRARGSFILL